MELFQVNILETDAPFFEGKCESLIVPTLDGALGILAHHSNVIAAIIPGSLYYKPVDGEMQEAAVSEGLVEVENGRALVLVNTAERPEEIDDNRVRRAIEEAEDALLRKSSIQEYRMAEANLNRALNRLRVKGHSAQRK
ncbi:MAG: ATP synthase F1 subunit epsilon [Oscillospiraceae bacterium]|nr:ATP synthase F1 subunit epsilon [Oscillospiraceae bacterium]